MTLRDRFESVREQHHRMHSQRVTEGEDRFRKKGDGLAAVIVILAVLLVLWGLSR